jgi:hypothetical protein
LSGAFNTLGAITQSGNQVLHAGNYNSYSPTLTGGGASGTWSINVTGTAAGETFSTVSTRGNSYINPSSGGISIGETFANYDGWNTQLNVHGGPHSRITVKTDTVRMGIYAHNTWQSVNGVTPGGFVGTYNNYPLSILVNSAQRMVFNTSGNIGIATDDFSYTTSDNTPVIGSITNNRLFINGSIQLIGSNDAIVFGRGASTFLKDEELGFGWGGGWYMNDATWIRARNDKNIITGGTISTGAVSSSGDITFSNGRKGLVGVYDASQTQAVFAMGPTYRLTDGGASNNYGNFYGLAWSYDPNYGGAGNNPQSKAGLSHQLLLMMAGITRTAIGSGIWTEGTITTLGGVTASGAITQGGNQVLHAGNYNSYSPTLTGGNASGTWGINVTGNAATATGAQSPTFTTTGNASWGGRVQLGGNGGASASVTTAIVQATDGNLHLDPGVGKTTYINYYTNGPIYATSSAHAVLHAGNYNSYSPTLTGGGASGTWGVRITGFANQGSQRLYSTDGAYNYDSANPYFGYLTYDGSRWLFQVSPGTPAAVRVAYADSAGTADQIDSWPFRNTGNNSGVNADTLESNGITYYNAGVTNFSGNSTDGALYSQLYSSAWQHQIAGDYRSGQIALRGKNNGTWQSWRTVLDSGNYNSYSPTLTGGNASGTWGINITGNSATVAGLAVHSGRNNVANQIVRTDGSGYIQAGWINTDSGNSGVENRLTRIYSSYDAYLRYSGLEDFKVHMGLSYKNSYSRRIDYTSDPHYWVGSMGHSGYGANETFHGGSGFFDIWSGTNYPGSLTHIHGFNALHYTTNSLGVTGGNAYGLQVAGQYTDSGELWSRACSGGTFSAWRRQLDSSNYNSYSPTLTGGNASGTWGINVTGTAGSISGFNNPTTAATGNTIAYRNGNGDLEARYFFAQYFNASSGNSENPAIGQIWTQSTGDNYLRKSTPAHFISQLGLITTSNYSSYALPLSGGTVTGTTYFNTSTGPTSGSLSGPSLQAYSTGNNAAYMSFHKAGNYAVNIGLDSDNVLRIGGWSAPANRWQLDMSGNGTFAGNVTAYSDERFKKDWATLEDNFVEKLAQVKSGTYSRTDENLRQVGVSAQSLQKVLPEAVMTQNDGVLSVAYGNAALASAVELAKEVVDLRNRVAQLESLINKLIGN